MAQEKELIKILNCFINNIEYAPGSDVDWKELYTLSSKHSVTGIVYHVMRDKLTSIPHVYAGLFCDSYYSTIFHTMFLESEAEKLIAAYEQNKLQNVFIKGFVLRELYPVPELRTMTDLDILMRQEDIPRALPIFESLGLTLVSEHSNQCIFNKENLHLEIHYHLASEQFLMSRFLKYFDDAFSHTSPFKGEYSLKLSNEYHFIFLLVHLAKHFAYCGAGIRLIMDIAVIFKNCGDSYDWNYIYGELKELKLLHFAKVIFALCKKWFDSVSPIDAPPLEVELYTYIHEIVFAHGTLGSGRDKEEIKQIRVFNQLNQNQQSKLKVFMIYLLPPDDEMRRSVKWYEKKPRILLPFAWIYRIFRGTLYRRDKSTLAVGRVLNYDLENSENTKILHMLGLDE